MATVKESETTIEARHKLIQSLRQQGFIIQEEMTFYCTKNFNGKKIEPPYRADIYIELKAIIELDPLSSHKSAHQKNHDEWRDTNIWEQHSVRTVRLVPEDILKDGGIELAGKEIISQLRADKYQK